MARHHAVSLDAARRNSRLFLGAFLGFLRRREWRRLFQRVRTRDGRTRSSHPVRHAGNRAHHRKRSRNWRHWQQCKRQHVHRARKRRCRYRLWRLCRQPGYAERARQDVELEGSRHLPLRQQLRTHWRRHPHGHRSRRRLRRIALQPDGLPLRGHRALRHRNNRRNHQ